MLDPQRLRQVLSNLLGNAAKFTAQGRIGVEVTYQRGTLEIAVSDTGIGIEPSKLRTIFDPFEQSDGRIRQSYGGTGLGLALVRAMVEALDGTVTVVSEVGRGSTFSLRIPAEVAAALPEGRNLPSLHGLSVLVVDDEPINRNVLRAMLEHLGARVRVADGLEDTLRAVSEAEVDVILMDLRMPGADGVEITRVLLQRFPERVFVIYGLSSSVSPGERARAKASGMVELVSKPLSLERLASLVLGDAVRDPQTPVQAIDREVWASVAEILGKPEEFLNRYQSHAFSQVEALEQAAEAEDWGQVREIAHAMKGASGSIGASGVQHWAASLESLCMKAATDQVAEKAKRGRRLVEEAMISLRAQASSS